jgi:hypothetical protein
MVGGLIAVPIVSWSLKSILEYTLQKSSKETERIEEMIERMR